MAIVAVDADDRVALVRQYRVPAGAILLEIPAGGLDVHDDGTKEDPAAAAPRELEEETGLRAATWRHLITYFSAPGFTEEVMHVYLATDLNPADPDGRLGPDEDERLLLSWLPVSEAIAAIDRGDIRDAKSIIGLFSLERLRAREGVATEDDDASATVGEVARATFRLSTSEVVRASVAMTRRSTAIRVIGLLMCALPLYAIVTTGDVLSLGFLALGISFVTGWFAAPFAWYQLRKRPDLVSAETTLTADDRGIHYASTMLNGLNRWDVYRSAHESSGFFFLDTSTGLNQIVPKRVFTPTDLATFYRLLDRQGLLGGSSAKRSARRGSSRDGSGR